jgi:hypothetical protein
LIESPGNQFHISPYLSFLYQHLISSGFSMMLSAITFLLIICNAFFAQAQEPKLCTKHFTVATATSENWNVGVVRNYSDTTGGNLFSIKIKMHRSGYINFTQLIINNQQFAIEAVKNGIREFKGTVQVGDSLVLISRTSKTLRGAAPNASIIEKLRTKHKVAAIVYILDDLTFFHPIESFVETKSMRRPQ